MKTLNFLLVTYLTVIPIASVTSAAIKPTDELIEQAKVISDINDVKLSHKVVRNGFEEFKKRSIKNHSLVVFILLMVIPLLLMNLTCESFMKENLQPVGKVFYSVLI